MIATSSMDDWKGGDWIVCVTVYGSGDGSRQRALQDADVRVGGQYARERNGHSSRSRHSPRRTRTPQRTEKHSLGNTQTHIRIPCEKKRLGCRAHYSRILATGTHQRWGCWPRNAFRSLPCSNELWAHGKTNDAENSTQQA